MASNSQYPEWMVLCARRWFFCFEFLQIVRHDDAGYRSLGLGYSHCAIHQMAHLRGNCSHMDIFMRYIFE